MHNAIVVIVGRMPLIKLNFPELIPENTLQLGILACISVVGPGILARISVVGPGILARISVVGSGIWTVFLSLHRLNMSPYPL
jgi:hypothetical protein